MFGLSLSDAFSQIIAIEGVGTLWNGTLPSLILVLNPAVQFMFYEAMKRKAGKGGKKVRRTQERHCCVEYYIIKATVISQPRLLFSWVDSVVVKDL